MDEIGNDQDEQQIASVAFVSYSTEKWVMPCASIRIRTRLSATFSSKEDSVLYNLRGKYILRVYRIRLFLRFHLGLNNRPMERPDRSHVCKSYNGKFDSAHSEVVVSYVSVIAVFYCYVRPIRRHRIEKHTSAHAVTLTWSLYTFQKRIFSDLLRTCGWRHVLHGMRWKNEYIAHLFRIHIHYDGWLGPVHKA